MGTQRLRRGPGCTVQACVYEQVQILVLVYTDDMCMVAGKVWVHVHMDRYTRLYTHTLLNRMAEILRCVIFSSEFSLGHQLQITGPQEARLPYWYKAQSLLRPRVTLNL